MHNETAINCGNHTGEPNDNNSSIPPGHDSKYPHLREEAAAMLTAETEQRCHFIRQDRFILHARAKKILSELKDILNSPKGVRPPCLALIGGSNEGKSAIIRRFLQDYEVITDETVAGNTDKMKIVSVEMPPRSTEPRMCLAIARAMGLPGYGTTKSRVVSDNVYRALRAKEVEMVIFNEAQHAYHLNALERSVSCDLMKGISNLGISVVAVGTPELRQLFSADVQIENRMRPYHLPSFAKDHDFCAFLHTLESYYPLPSASNLSSDVMMTTIYKLTNGVTGEVVQLCNAAAVHAVRTNKSSIDLALLRNARSLPTENLRNAA